MPEIAGSEKGSLLLGALRSCISRYDPSVDTSGLAFFEFPTFVGCSIDGFVHVMVGSISSADIGPYLAFAAGRSAKALNIYLSPAALSGVPSQVLPEVASVLGLQGEGFGVEVKVLQAGKTGLASVEHGTKLQAVIQDEHAGEEFLGNGGARDALSLVAGSQCETLFIRDRMIVTYLGLEVARSISNHGEISLEIGVGRNDRMAKTWLGEMTSQAEQLRETIDTVRRFRLGGSQFHPLAKLSTARWMRLALQDNPGLIAADRVTPIELARTGSWPGISIWSLKGHIEPVDEDGLVYQGFDPSFEDDNLSFAIAARGVDAEYVICIADGIDIGAVAKLYEVTRTVRAQGRKIKGSILVLQERNRISSIERLVNMASFDLKSATIPPMWKIYYD